MKRLALIALLTACIPAPTDIERPDDKLSLGPCEVATIYITDQIDSITYEYDQDLCVGIPLDSVIVRPAR